MSEAATARADAARTTDEALHGGGLCNASLNRALASELRRAVVRWLSNPDAGACLHRKAPLPPRDRPDRFDTNRFGMTGPGREPGAQGLRCFVVRWEQAERSVARGGEW